MKILVAMNEFKGSLSSKELGEVISNKINKYSTRLSAESISIADGGDGFLSIFSNFEVKKTITLNSIKKEVESMYLLSKDGKSAVIEVAEVVGLKQLSEEEKNPYNTTTVGLGILINSLINDGVRHFIIGLGGSATNDSGIGMLSGLGYEFFSEDGALLKDGIDDLKRVVSMSKNKVNPKLKEVSFTLVSDVDNPLCGKNGATYIYAKQKGLKEEDFEEVDGYFKNFATLVANSNAEDYSLVEGSGAAGGLGFAFLSFTKAKIEKGSEFMIDYLELDKKMPNYDLLITGEGRLDGQSFMGKAPIEVAKIAKKYNKKVIFLAGHILDDELEELDASLRNIVDVSFSIQRGVISLEDALKKENTIKNVERTVEQIVRLLEFYDYEK